MQKDGFDKVVHIFKNDLQSIALLLTPEVHSEKAPLQRVLNQ